MKRFAILFLALAGSAFAQSTLFPQELREYLTLTPVQVANIINLQNSFFDIVDGDEERQSALQAEVRRELRKPQPDPLVVGTKIVEIEMIDRQLETKYMETIAAIRRELTDPQKAKMKTLEDAYRLVPLIEQAQDAGLWDPTLEDGPFFLFSEKGQVREAVSRVKKAAAARRKTAKR